ncbi:MAG: hypothetical protein WD894_23490 [Pirellulales bacterium]
MKKPVPLVAAVLAGGEQWRPKKCATGVSVGSRRRTATARWHWNWPLRPVKLKREAGRRIHIALRLISPCRHIYGQIVPL